MASNFYRIDGWPVAPLVARAFLAMRDAARADGVTLSLNSGYRTYSEQVEIFTRRYRQGAFSPFGDYRRFRGVVWGRIDPGGPVASPDAVSNHMRGYALDIAMLPGAFEWLLRNAERFGFNWIEGRAVQEPWHWCYQVAIVPDGQSPDPWRGRGAPDPVLPSDPGMPLSDLTGGTGSGGSHSGNTVNTVNPLEIDMPLLYQPNSGPWKGKHYAIGQGYIKHIPSKDDVKMFIDAHHTLGLTEIFVSDATFRALLSVNGIDEKVLDKNGYVFDYRTSEKYTRGGSYSRGDDESAKRVYRTEKAVSK